MMANRMDDNFDKALGKALKSHSGPVPYNFTERVLGQIRREHERKVLARVVLQERLALAGCIVLGGIMLIVWVTSANAAADFTELMRTSINKANDTIVFVISQWQSFAVFVVALGFVLYSFMRFHLVDT
jgi:hypothetical protein